MKEKIENKIEKLEKQIEKIDDILETDKFEEYISKMESCIETELPHSIAEKVFKKVQEEKVQEEKVLNFEEEKKSKLVKPYAYLRVACFAFLLSIVTYNVTPYMNTYKQIPRVEGKIQEGEKNFNKKMNKIIKENSKIINEKLEEGKEKNKMKKRNILLTMGFAFIPGAGQMYQNLMKRGISLMAVTGALVVLAEMFASPVFLVPFLILMAYSFFDTFNTRNLTDDEREKYVDDYIWNAEEISKILSNKKKFNGGRTLGIIFVAFGIYYLIDEVLVVLLYRIGLEVLAEIIARYMPTILISVGAIYLGLKMIKNEEKK